MKIELTDAELRIADWVGKQRNARDQKAGAFDRPRRSPQYSAEEVSCLGMAGELAAAKLLNVYPDFDTTPGGARMDLYWLGLGIDVKTRPANGPGRDLLVLPSPRVHADMYALMIADRPRFTLVGFARRDQVFAAIHRCDLGHGELYKVPQEKMVPWSQIFGNDWRSNDET